MSCDINARINPNVPNPYLCPTHGEIQGHYTNARYESGRVVTTCCRCRAEVTPNPAHVAHLAAQTDDFSDLLDS